MQLRLKQRLVQKRRWRIRRRIRGDAQRPRLVVSFSCKHLYAQVIDDTVGSTLVFVSSNCKDMRDLGIRPTIEGSAKMGQIAGERVLAAGIGKVVFDRAGRRYHGKVKAFAEAVRVAGVQF